MGSVVLDANVVIALLQRDDIAHERARRDVTELLADRIALRMPASAYAEALVYAVRAGAGAAVDTAIDALGVEIVATDRRIGRRAAELRAAMPTVRLPDALVWATADVLEARLVTYDARLAAAVNA
jgi:predicted nucleic acid-binding protein